MALQRRAACAEPVSTRRHCGVGHGVVAAKEGGKRPEKTIIHLNCLLTLYAAN